MMPDDLSAFVDWLKTLPATCPELAAGFVGDRPIFAARAPGRLDVMGGIADYSGSLVLQMPIAEAACCAVQLNDSGRIEAISIDPTAPSCRHVSLPIDLLRADAEKLHDHLQADPDSTWAAYLVGPVNVLLRRCELESPGGMRLLLRSDVPEGKGISSSAAVEVATMRAAAAALEQTPTGEQIALWCQEAENRVAGAPCGVMDQMTAALGRTSELLALRCQPAQVLGHRPLPGNLAVWGIDSNVRHAVSGSDYTAVRTAAFAGYAYIARAAGMPITQIAPGRIHIDDDRWHGYVANVTPAEFEGHFSRHVPEHATGEQLLDDLGGTCDPVTRIDPQQTYAVRACVRHPIHEHFRVRLFARLLSGEVDQEAATLLGELMYQSHASYSACSLGCDGTDELVKRVRAAGVRSGLFGAKITGGGSGGTVAVLGHREAGATVHKIAEDYARTRGCQPRVFTGSSPGATAVSALVTLLEADTMRRQ